VSFYGTAAGYFTQESLEKLRSRGIEDRERPRPVNQGAVPKNATGEMLQAEAEALGR